MDFGKLFLKIIVLASGVVALSQRRYNSFSLVGSQLSCDKDFNMCIGGGNQSFTTRLWVKSKNQFTVVRNYITQCYVTTCSVRHRYMAEDGSHIVMIADYYARVYTLNNSEIQLKQEINATILTSVYNRNNYLILYNSNDFQLWQYNATTSTYSLIMARTKITNSFLAFCMSQDGSLIIALQANHNISIFSRSGTSYTSIMVGIVTPGGFNYRDVSLSKRNGSYILIICFCDTGYGSQKLYYYKVTPTTMTLIQKIDQNLFNSSIHASYTPYKFWLANSGSYIIMSTRQSSLFVYEYSDATDAYNKTHLLGCLPFSGSQMAITSSENASFIIDRFTFYFVCQVSYCQSCSWIKVCAVCEDGYTLTDGLCGCGTNRSMVGTTCVNCSIQNCAQCLSDNICLNCSNGYSANGSTCICSIGSTINSTGACVSCNISSCDRCDKSNVCALYSLVSLPQSNASASVSTNSTANTNSINSSAASASNGELDLLKVFIIVVVVIVIGLSIGMILILKKLGTFSPDKKVYDTQKLQQRGSSYETQEAREIEEINKNFQPQNVNSEIYLTMNLQSIHEGVKKRRPKVDLSMEDL